MELYYKAEEDNTILWLDYQKQGDGEKPAHIFKKYKPIFKRYLAKATPKFHKPITLISAWNCNNKKQCMNNKQW